VIGALDVIGLVALGRGRPMEARRWLEESLASGRLIGEVQFILTPLWGLAETDLLMDDTAAAIGRCEEAWAIANSTGERALFIPFAVTGTRSLIAARRPDDAERWVARAREHLAAWEPVARPSLSHADGLVRLAAGSLSAAREALEHAVRGWEERGRVWEATWARVDLASCLLRMSRYPDAAKQLASARDTSTNLGSMPLVSRIDELLEIAHRHGSFDEPWRPLTAREFEVARLIASGLTNAEIAGELAIAPKTASAHVEHILAKLGVARRAEIATWAATVAHPAAGVPGSRPGVIASP
jgi:DNA-binding CsgD family transcriptional regulator